MAELVDARRHPRSSEGTAAVKATLTRYKGSSPFLATNTTRSSDMSDKQENAYRYNLDSWGGQECYRIYWKNEQGQNQMYALVMGMSDKYAGRARRITACLNRLASFTTEQIENGIDLVALEAQRAALVALLQEVIDTPPEGWSLGDAMDLIARCRKALRAGGGE